MADEWVGIVKAVAPKYLKGAADLTVRRRLILKMLEARGLISLNYMGSHTTKFDVDYKEPPVESYGDGGIVHYERRDYLKQGEIDWRGYVATDLMTLKEQEESKGDTVLVDRYKRIFPKLTKSVRQAIGLEFYSDGSAAGNENRFAGLETFCGKGECAATDIIAQPNDTYLGLSTTLGQGGRWSTDLLTKPNATVATDWPEGEGSTEYDYWSPKLVNWSSSAWGTSKTAWKDNCETVLRRTIQWLSLTAGIESSTLLCVLAGHMFTEWKDALSAKQRILVPFKEAADLGFNTDVLNFEGLAVQTEFGIKANTGYVVNVDTTELCILPDDLIKSKGPDYDADSLSWKFSVYTFGNFKFLPKACAKLFNYA